MSKVLFIGDVHIKKQNLGDVDKLISKIESWDEALPDIALVAGDVLDTHERLQTQLMNKAYELVSALRRKMLTYILVGNHDYINNSQFLSHEHWMTGLKELDNVVVVDYPTVYEKHGSKIVFVPYVPPGRFVEALDKVEWKDATCIFAHQEIKGCKMGAIVSIEGDKWDESWPFVVSGHIHEKQRPQSNVYYPGSALNHSYGYDCQGLTIVNTVTHEDVEIPLHFTKKQTLYLTIDEIVKLVENDNKLVPNNRFSVTGAIPDIIAFKKTPCYEKIKAVCKIVFRPVNTVKIKTESKPQRHTFPFILSQMIASESDALLEKDYSQLLS